MKMQIKVGEQIFTVELGDLSARPIQAVVDGEVFEVTPEEQSTPAVLPQVKPVSATSSTRPAAPANGKKTQHVVAPIPGVILSISVKPGDAVVFGQELCILEAMKMKNVIRANRAGTISIIHVAEQEHVRHSQLLMEYTE
ncbi:MAG TPA: biotin/lipoyl-containing protein [Anaerolineaceae bacterium]